MTVLGPKQPNDVYALMREAAVLLSTSTSYETFGRVAVEAFATGLPVIASRLGAMAEVVSDGQTGLHFEPGDPVDLATQVERGFRDPGRLAEMGRSARDEFLSKYTLKRNCEALMRIYDLAARRRFSRAVDGTIGPSMLSRSG